MKFFAYFTNHLWMRADDGLVATTFAPCVVKTRINGVAVAVETDTAYPFKDEVRFTVRPERPVRFSLRLRQPTWNGNGWRVETREWKNGDTLTLSFAPRVLRKTTDNGDSYWQRGPLVYALPVRAERHATKEYPIPGFADWDYAPAADA